MMLGASENDQIDDPEESDPTPLEKDLSKLTLDSTASHGISPPEMPTDGYKSRRTSSLAFDRLLSTLLVEIDGIGISTRIQDSIYNLGEKYSSSNKDLIAINEERDPQYLTTSSGGAELNYVASTPLEDRHQVIVIATASSATRLDRYIFLNYCVCTF